MKYCTYCGVPNDDNNMNCPTCGMAFPQGQLQQVNQQMYCQNIQQAYGAPQMGMNSQQTYGAPQMGMNPQQTYGAPQMGMNSQQTYGAPQMGMNPQQGYGMPQPPYNNQGGAPKKKTGLFIAIGVSVIAIIAVIVAVLLSKKDDKDKGGEDERPSAYMTEEYKSKDVSSCKTIKTAVEISMGYETLYVLLTENGPTVMTIIPDQKHEDMGELTYGKASYFLTLTGGAAQASGDVNGKTALEARDIFAQEIAQNIGEETPDIKYDYDALTEEEADLVYYVHVSEKGTVRVYIGKKGLEQDILNQSEDELWGCPNGENGYYSICPELCDSYKQK
ncbi:MAG: hypothetical protein IJO70_07860 [Lachnospiraceae bacterium]|nr:hypothetical protein [Lachnospiraceae bacterium]